MDFTEGTSADEQRAFNETVRAALQGMLAGWSTFYPHQTDEARMAKAVAMAHTVARMAHDTPGRGH